MQIKYCVLVSVRSFEGLTVTEASKLGSYLHFREARILPTKPLLEKANLDKSLDFLDPIDEDIPKVKSNDNNA